MQRITIGITHADTGGRRRRRRRSIPRQLNFYAQEYRGIGRVIRNAKDQANGCIYWKLSRKRFVAALICRALTGYEYETFWLLWLLTWMCCQGIRVRHARGRQRQDGLAKHSNRTSFLIGACGSNITHGATGLQRNACAVHGVAERIQHSTDIVTNLIRHDWHAIGIHMPKCQH